MAPMLKSENGRLISWVFIDIEGTSIGEYIATAKTALDAELVVPPVTAIALQVSTNICKGRCLSLNK